VEVKANSDVGTASFTSMLDTSELRNLCPSGVLSFSKVSVKIQAYKPDRGLSVNVKRSLALRSMAIVLDLGLNPGRGSFNVSTSAKAVKV